jgi:hypothetical protein
LSRRAFAAVYLVSKDKAKNGSVKLQMAACYLVAIYWAMMQQSLPNPDAKAPRFFHRLGTMEGAERWGVKFPERSWLLWGVGLMDTYLASTLRPAPVSWNRRFMRFGWAGLAPRLEAKMPDAGQRTEMNSEPRSPSRSVSPSEEAGRPTRDSRLRAGRTIQFQLSGRLKAIYADETTMPDAIRNLAMRIEARLQSRG